MRRLLALTLFQRGLAVGVYTIATMILARLLTPAQIGVYSLSAAFLAIANVVREFGVTEYLLQEKTLDRQRIRAAFGVALVVGWTLGGAVLLLRHPIAHFYGEPGVSRVMAILALTFAFLPFATPMTALLYRDLEIAKVLWIQTASMIVGHITSVSLAWAGFGYMALAWSTVANSASMVLWLMFTRRDGWHAPSLRGSGPIWSYCTKFTMSGLLEAGRSNVHEFVIGRRFGFADLGLYSRASALFTQFNQNIGRGISRVLLPSFAQQAREGATDLKQRYLRTLEIYTATTWPLFGYVAVVAPEIIRVMFGPQWTASAPLLRLLCFGAAIQSAYAFAGDLLGGMGRAGTRLRITAVTAPLWVAVCLAASFVSLQAIALATAVPATVTLLLYMKWLRPLIGLTPGESLAATRSSLALAALVMLVTVSARALTLKWTHLAFVVLVITLCVAAGAWLVAARALRHPVAGEIRIAWRAGTGRFSRR